MNQIIRKYLISVLNPEEYSKISDFLADPKNEEEIYRLIKPFWNNEMNEESVVREPNPEVLNKIRQAILVEERDSLKHKLLILKRIVQIAAILVMGVIISSLYFFRKSTQEHPLAQIQTISTPFGAKTNFKLPDGSVVWLNSGSTVSFRSRFDQVRLVDLKGEAFFEVTKNGLPFIVSTQYGNVEAKGTSFNVNAFTGENFQTTLLTGIVNVTEKLTGKEVTLKPGQQAGQNGNELKVENVDTNIFSSWKDGKLIFKNEYLPSVIKRLERWYNVKIDLAPDKRISDISYTGVIEMESFSEVLHLLKVTAPIDFRYNKQTRIMRIIYKKTI